MPKMMPKRAIFDQKTAPLSTHNDAKTMLDMPAEKSVVYDRFARTLNCSPPVSVAVCDSKTRNDKHRNQSSESEPAHRFSRLRSLRPGRKPLGHRLLPRPPRPQRDERGAHGPLPLSIRLPRHASRCPDEPG